MGIPITGVIGYISKNRERFGRTVYRQITLYDVDFSRWDEIRAYAELRGKPVSAAIVELVNEGLSHLDD